MSVNKATLHLGNRLKNTLKRHDRYLRELKTPQRIGADILQVMDLPGTFGNYEQSFTLSAGASVNFILTVNPSISIQTLCNYQVTLYIDSLDNGQFGAYYGNTLTAGQLNLQWVHWLDFADTGQISPFDVDQKVIKSFVKNNDTATHTYYLQYQLQIPKMPGVTATTSD